VKSGFAVRQNIAIIQPLLQKKKSEMRLIMPLILILLISACGKTGALYLPESDGSAEETPTEAPVNNIEEASRGSL